MTVSRLKEILLEVLDVIYDEDESLTSEERFDRVIWAGSLSEAEARELNLFERYDYDEEQEEE